MENEVNERIRIFSKEKGLTAAGLATAAGTSVSAAYVIFRDQAKPSFDMLNKVALAFPDLSMEWLLRGRGPMLSATAVNDPACWDLLKREEEQHAQLRTDYHELKLLFQKTRSDYERLANAVKQFAPNDLLNQLGVS